MSDLDQPTPQQWATQALRHMRKIRDLEISNAELTTRVAELEAAGAYRVAAQEVEQLEIDNEALTKRVAELEENAILDMQLIEDQRKEIADLQSQRQIDHWSLEQAYENVKKLSLQLRLMMNTRAPNTTRAKK